jgi:peptidylprolyl isomerase
MPFATLIAAVALLQGPQVTVTDDKVGEGEAAKMGDIVTVNYVGRVLNGVIFDSTKMTAPFSFPLGSRPLLQGHARLPFISFDKALVGMKLGGKRTLVIPGELAFGELQVGDFPAGEKLTFEVELLDVHPKDQVGAIKVEEVKEGVGEPSATGDTIEANYTGTFLNGSVFDSSRNQQLPDGSTRDAPITVVLGQKKVIAGFEQALTGMKAGGKRKVTIPYDLAYGKNGRRGIPAYAVLVFDLEAVRVQKKP